MVDWFSPLLHLMYTQDKIHRRFILMQQVLYRTK